MKKNYYYDSKIIKNFAFDQTVSSDLCFLF